MDLHVLLEAERSTAIGRRRLSINVQSRNALKNISDRERPCFDEILRTQRVYRDANGSGALNQGPGDEDLFWRPLGRLSNLPLRSWLGLGSLLGLALRLLHASYSHCQQRSGSQQGP